MSPLARCGDRGLIALFLAALGAPTLDQCLRPDARRGPEPEGRRARPAPALDGSAAALAAFPAAFEEHFHDRHGLRDVLLALHSRVALGLFGISPTPQVVLGREGWMFYTGERSLEVWRGQVPFAEAELAAWQDMLEARQAFLAELGVAYVFCVAPNKEAIYDDYLPAELNHLGPTRLDQLAAWMAERSEVEFVDLRPRLLADRAQDTPGHFLYYEEGTHWNGRGAWSACDEILRRLARRFPAATRHAPEDWTRSSRPADESWRERMYLELAPERLQDEWQPVRGGARALVFEEGEGRRTHEQADARLPRVVFFHDSFGPAIEGLLAERCSSLRCVQGYSFDAGMLCGDPPDLVLELFVERTLVGLDPAALVPGAPPFVFAGVPPREVRQRRYEAATERRYALDPAADLPGALETTGAATLERIHDARGPGLAVRIESGADTLVFPALEPAPRTSLVVHLVLESPLATEADLFFQRAGEVGWQRGQNRPLGLQAGENRLYVEFAPALRVQRLRLRPGRAPGETYVVRAFEVRGVRGS